MTSSIGGNVTHGVAYVVAKNSDEAYKRVRTHLDKHNIGFSSDRELNKVELIAEADDYPDCGIRLFNCTNTNSPQNELDEKEKVVRQFGSDVYDEVFEFLHLYKTQQFPTDSLEILTRRLTAKIVIHAKTLSGMVN